MEDTYLEIVKTNYMFNIDEVTLTWDFAGGKYYKFVIRCYSCRQNERIMNGW